VADATTLHSAAAGDEAAFAALVRPFERELHVHCYRLLGSVHAADDALQETLLSAWRALGQFEGRSSLRTWLYRIATSRCLNAIRDGARRPQAAPLPPFDPPEPTSRESVTWLEPYPQRLLGPEDTLTARAGIELAFIAALQSLPPRQTAALVLCDVLDFRLSEAADMLGSTVIATKGLLQRARAAMPPPLDLAPADAEVALAAKLAEAYARDDVDGVVALLTDDAWLRMPPAPHCYQGVDAISRFLRVSAAGRGGRYTLVATGWEGGHPAYACLLDGENRGRLVVTASPDGQAVSAVHRFLA
jgi:RNA polymerase sigma-70 factor (TIGR02960 family)